MSKRWMIPMIDFVFLSLGGLLAMLTQTEIISSVPLDLARGDGAGALESIEPEKDVVSVTAGGVSLNDGAVTIEGLSAAIASEIVLVRCDRDVTVDRLTAVLTAVHASGERDVRLQFRAVGGAAE